jgi:hypothetical protein
MVGSCDDGDTEEPPEADVDEVVDSSIEPGQVPPEDNVDTISDASIRPLNENCDKGEKSASVKRDGTTIENEGDTLVDGCSELVVSTLSITDGELFVGIETKPYGMVGCPGIPDCVQYESLIHLTDGEDVDSVVVQDTGEVITRRSFGDD